MNSRVAVQSVEQLRGYLQRGNPAAGMPAFADLPDDDLRGARSLPSPHQRRHHHAAAGRCARTHSRVGSAPAGDWRTYNGSDSANRYSPLTQITRANVGSLKVKWVFPMPHFGLEVTPLAADGVLYVTGPNQVVALDAVTGRALWTLLASAYTRDWWATRSLAPIEGSRCRGDNVFFVTDNAHLLALDRGTGALRWETPMAPDAPPSEPPHHYGGTVAPLVVRDMVVVGVAGARDRL